ncbi:MAG: DUF502 domain-containing protein [Candidatus Marinimicrobia bacterium]|nr:DUF502 domain-containing protein [Candidatus Neomarinimicrobiota bacterium]
MTLKKKTHGKKKISLKNDFLSGLLVVIPLGITLFALQFLFLFFDNITGQYFREFLPFYIPGIGLLFSIIVILLIGIFVNHWLGKKLFHSLERRIVKLPLLGSVYTVTRQILEIFGSSRKRREFQKVIFLQYPKEGIWTIGFVTGHSLSANNTQLYNVFVPTTPNPTSGYMIFIPIEDAVESPLTIEEGMRIVISGGIVAPPRMPFPAEKIGILQHEESSK